jgi:hypothetical protein
VEHYKAVDRLLRRATDLAEEVADLNPPASVLCPLMQFVGALSTFIESNKRPLLPTRPDDIKVTTTLPGEKKVFPPGFDKRAYAVGLAKTNSLLSKKDIAEEIDVDPSTVSRWPEVEDAILDQKRGRAERHKNQQFAEGRDAD